MTLSVEREQETYQLVITRRAASEVLFLESEASCSLPNLSVLLSQRIVEQLFEMILNTWNLRAHCLWIGRPRPANRGAQNGFAIFDTFDSATEPPAGMVWLKVAALECTSAHISYDSLRLVQAALTELASHKNHVSLSSFARPGWIRQLFDWTEAQIDQFGYRLTGVFRQFSGDATSCLIRIETTGPAVWFKAPGAEKRQELPITVALATLFPASLPPVIAVHRDWNGWLAFDVPGSSLEQVGDIATWEHVAGALAELQIASTTKCSDLLAVGCRDLSLSRIMQLIDPFLARTAACMERRERETSIRLGRAEFVILADALKDSVSRLQEIRLPDTLSHIDLNWGNVVCSAEGCVFLDWAEAAVSLPLTTFEFLRELARRSHVRGYGASVRINAAYLRPWRALASRDDLAEALTYSPLLAVFTYALACDGWGEQSSRRTPGRAWFLRALTRRMYREALKQRSSPCRVPER
jgi:hypothetical protein